MALIGTGGHGPDCLRGGEDVVTYESKLWWLQLLRDFDCTVTSTWVDAENLGECHTWRAWGSRVRKKQLDEIMGPRDLVLQDMVFEQNINWHLGPFSGGGED